MGGQTIRAQADLSQSGGAGWQHEAAVVMRQTLEARCDLARLRDLRPCPAALSECRPRISSAPGTVSEFVLQSCRFLAPDAASRSCSLSISLPCRTSRISAPLPGRSRPGAVRLRSVCSSARARAPTERFPRSAVEFSVKSLCPSGDFHVMLDRVIGLRDGERRPEVRSSDSRAAHTATK